MEGNDLGGSYLQRIVVVLEGLLYKPPEDTMAVRALAKFGKWEKLAQRWTMSDEVCKWIVFYARQYSVPVEIWSLLPEPLFDELIVSPLRICGEYIADYRTFATIHEAYVTLQANPDITAVYDGDRDRIEKYWHMRAVYVERGSLP